MQARQRGRWSAKTLGIVAALTVSGLLAACGSDDDSTPNAGGGTTVPSSPDVTEPSTDSPVETTDSPSVETTDGGGEEPVSGGTLTYLNLTDTNGFDPALSNTPGSQNGVMNYAVFDVLAHESPATGEIVFGLLESAESTDATTWTFKLKPGVMFTDGTPLDAEAVKYNWERLADPATGALSMQAAQSVTEISVVDDTTFEAVLGEPNSQFVRTVATTALSWIGSPTALQADPEGFNTKPVGAGAYVLRDAVPGSEYVFDRNPDYYGTTYVDELRVKIIPDDAQRLAALRSGDGDIAQAGTGVTATQGKEAGFESYTSVTNGGYVMFFNTTRAPFDDLKVRKAFALAMNAQELSDTIYSGDRPVATNLFQETSTFYDERFDQPESDAAEAQRLFDEIAAENGGPLEVTLSHIIVLQPEAEWFQAKLAGFDNVKVNLELVSTEEFRAKWTQGESQFGMHAYFFLDPIDLGKFVVTDGPVNFSLTADPEIDAALAEGAAAIDEEERIEAYAKVQQKIVDDIPFTVMTRVESTDLYNGDKVHGMGPESRVSAGGMLKVTEIWVTE